jgi:hypothetical protein
MRSANRANAAPGGGLQRRSNPRICSKEQLPRPERGAFFDGWSDPLLPARTQEDVEDSPEGKSERDQKDERRKIENRHSASAQVEWRLVNRRSQGRIFSLSFSSSSVSVPLAKGFAFRRLRQKTARVS